MSAPDLHEIADSAKGYGGQTAGILANGYLALEAELAALRVELQAALTDVQNGIEAFNVLAGVADSLEAALRDAREALREWPNLIRNPHFDFTMAERVKLANAIARAVLDEGAHGARD